MDFFNGGFCNLMIFFEISAILKSGSEPASNAAFPQYRRSFDRSGMWASRT